MQQAFLPSHLHWVTTKDSVDVLLFGISSLISKKTYLPRGEDPSVMFPVASSELTFHAMPFVRGYVSTRIEWTHRDMLLDDNLGNMDFRDLYCWPVKSWIFALFDFKLFFSSSAIVAIWLVCDPAALDIEVVVFLLKKRFFCFWVLVRK